MQRANHADPSSVPCTNHCTLASPHAAKSSSVSALARQETKYARAQRTQAHHHGARGARTCTGTTEKKGLSMAATRHTSHTVLVHSSADTLACPHCTLCRFTQRSVRHAARRPSQPSSNDPVSPPLRPRPSSARFCTACDSQRRAAAAHTGRAARDAQAADRRVSGSHIRGPPPALPLRISSPGPTAVRCQQPTGLLSACGSGAAGTAGAPTPAAAPPAAPASVPGAAATAAAPPPPPCHACCCCR